MVKDIWHRLNLAGGMLGVNLKLDKSAVIR
jgi:hypothetical protein